MSFFVIFGPFSLPFLWKIKVAGKWSSGGSKLLQVFSSWSWIVSRVWFTSVAKIPLSFGRERQLCNIHFDKSRSGMRSFCYTAKISFRVDKSLSCCYTLVVANLNSRIRGFVEHFSIAGDKTVDIWSRDSVGAKFFFSLQFLFSPLRHLERRFTFLVVIGNQKARPACQKWSKMLQKVHFSCFQPFSRSLKPST